MLKKRPVKRNNCSSLDTIASGIDFLLQGRGDIFCGPDFLMGRNLYKHLIRDSESRSSYPIDNEFVTSLVQLKAINSVLVPKSLGDLQKEYKKQRTELGNYQEKSWPLIFEHEIDAAIELGNLDKFNNKVIIGNNAELNVFYDYVALYTKIDKIRFIKYWAKKNTKFINKNNKQVALALEQAKIAVLRIDRNLDNGAIIVTDIITQTSYILMDLALNRSNKEGHFYICSILDLGVYVMTSGTGILLSTNIDICKSILTIVKKHLPLLRKTKTAFNNNIIKCVREIFSFALHNDILANITANTEFYK